MKYSEILGTKLKSDFLIDLFETYDADVVYVYDRNYEGMNDEYRASIPDMGLEFLFNKDQSLTTLFMSQIEHDGHNPFAGPDPRKPKYNTIQEAVAYANKAGIDFQHQEERIDSFFGMTPEWVKFNLNDYSIHYQFNNAGVDTVTLQMPSHTN